LKLFIAVSLLNITTHLSVRPYSSLGLLVQMWTAWFWCGYLDNECNDITVPAECCVSKKKRSLYTVVCL